MKKALYAHLTQLAYRLQQSENPLDHDAAGWILSRSNWEQMPPSKQRPRRKRLPRSVTVRLKDTKAGEFKIPHDLLEQAEAEAETYQGWPP